MEQQMRQMFIHLGFSQAVAASIVNDHGIVTLTDLLRFEPSDIDALCKNIQRPGGTIPGRNNQQVPNPGMPISTMAQSNLKLATFWIMHRLERVQRPTAPSDVTRAAIDPFSRQQKTEDTYEAPTEPPKIDEKNWAKTMEAMDEWLRLIPGERRLPLAYVIRKDIALPGDEDPAESYPSITDEMVRRAPIGTMNPDGTITYHPTFRVNNCLCFDKLAAWARDHSCWTYIKPFAKSRDGRKAWMALFNHYLGPNNVQNQAAQAEKTLRALTYVKDSRNFTFETYVTKTVEQHGILEGLTEYGYQGIDDGTKVRLFLEGITAPELEVVKTRILSDAGLRMDFEGCSVLFKDFLKQKRAAQRPPTRTIAHVNARKKRKSDNTSSDVTVEDRYYRQQEYNKLTPAQKEKLKSIREARGHTPGSKSSKKKVTFSNDMTKNFEAVTRQISALTSSVELLTKKSDGNEDHSDSDADTQSTKSSAKGKSGYTKALSRKQ
jgi:hypothetical protein